MLPAFDRIILLTCLLLIIFLAALSLRHGEGSPLAACVLGGYIVTVLYITVISRTAITDIRLHLIPFENFNRIRWIGFAENVILFLPAGALLPASTDRSAQSGLWFGGFLSLSVELIQLISRRGIADIDDLLANTLGGLLGMAWYCLIQKIFSS